MADHRPYDAAVVGLGAMGSAALAHLAARGARAIGVEQYRLGHDRGASAGATRIIRKAYFEHSAYVPLLQRAYELWRELERRAGVALLRMCGVLIVDDAEGATARGVFRAAREHAISLEIYDAASLRRTYPEISVFDREIGILERDAGVVYPEEGIAAHLAMARDYGAVLCDRTAVCGWSRATNGTMRVALANGDAIEARHVVVTAGAWLAELTARPWLQVQRNVQYWFAPHNSAFSGDRFPAFFLERASLPAPLYGVPDFGEGLKAALHAYGETTRASGLRREVLETEIDEMRSTLRTFLPEASGTCVRTKACMYALTPDRHFAIGQDSQEERVIVACGFSGHGYKFAPVIGEVLAELVVEGRSTLDIGFLDIRRLHG